MYIYNCIFLTIYCICIVCVARETLLLNLIVCECVAEEALLLNLCVVMNALQ